MGRRRTTQESAGWRFAGPGAVLKTAWVRILRQFAHHAAVSKKDRLLEIDRSWRLRETPAELLE